MAKTTPEQKRRKTPLAEKVKRLGVESVAAARKGGLRQLTEYIGARSRDFLGKVGPYHQQVLLDMAGHAMAYNRAAELQIDAIANPEKRYRSSTVVKEADPRHSDRCEDEAICDDSEGLYAVFDGNSLPEGGDKAAVEAARVIQQRLQGTPANATVEQVKILMTEALQEAHRAIKLLPINQGKADQQRAGTTGTVAKIHQTPDGKRTAIIGQVGDSRAYKKTKTGELIQITSDHSVLYNLVKAGQCTQELADRLNKKFANLKSINELDNDPENIVVDYTDTEHHQLTELALYNKMNQVSRTLGSYDLYSQPDIYQVALADGEELVLTSDGIHDLLDHATMEQTLRETVDRQTAAQNLLAASKFGSGKSRKGPSHKSNDDRTVIIAGLEDTLAPIITRVAEEYIVAAKSGDLLPVPYDVVGQEAFKAARIKNATILHDAFVKQYGKTGFADGTEIAAWRMIGIDGWVDEVLTKENPADVPDEVTTVSMESPEVKEQRYRQALNMIRAAFYNRDTLSVSTDEHVKALQQLKTESATGDQAKEFTVWLRNNARGDKKLSDDLLNLGFAEVEGAYGTELENYHTEPIPFYPDYYFERSLLREVQTKNLVAEGKLGNDALTTLEFLDQANIIGDVEVMKKLNGILEHIGETDTELTALTSVQELAKTLGMNVADVATVITAQRAALVEQAALQEKSGRSWKRALSKGAGYLATGLVGGLYISAAAVNPLFLTGGIAVAKLVDVIATHGVHNKTRKKIEQDLFNTLATERAAFKDVAQATGLLKITLENFAAGLAAQKERQLVLGQKESENELGTQLERELIFKNCSAESKALDEAEAAYNKIRDLPGDEAEIKYITLLKVRAAFDQAAEPYRRIAAAQGSIAKLEQARLLQADKAAKPRIMEWAAAVLGYKGEMISEKLASSAFFTAVAVAGREWVPVRIAASAFAGARLGDVLATFATRKLDARAERKRDASLLTVDQLTKVDPKQPDEAFTKIQALRPAAAATREKLTEATFQKRKPAEHRALQQLLQRYEQMQAWAEACRAIRNFDETESAAWQKETTSTKRRTLVRYLIRASGFAAGALAGFWVGSELAELAAHKVEAAATIPDERPSIEDEVTQTSRYLTDEEINPTMSSADQPAPDVLNVEPASAAVTPIGKPTVIKGGQGISHGLSGKMSQGEMVRLLHDQKVTIGGHAVTLADTGVAKAGTLEVSLVEKDGRTAVEFLDARTHQEIPADKLGDYLYDRSSGTGPVHTPYVEAPPQVDHLVEPAPAVHAAAAPEDTGDYADHEHEAAPPPERAPVVRSDVNYEARTPASGEKLNDYIASGMREWIAVNPDYAQYAGLPNDQLVSRSELSDIRDRLADAFRTAHQETAEAAVAGAGYVTEDGKLTEAGTKELSLAEHISTTGQPERYNDFKKEILTLLEAVKQDRVTTPNGLVFEQRGEELYVDLAGGGREAYLVDEHLYDHLMSAYRAVVEPKYIGKFNQDIFYEALDRGNTPHTLHDFELKRMDLQSFRRGGEPLPYAYFNGEVERFMTDHKIDQFTTPNGLVFRQEGDQLYVDVAGGAADKYPVTEELYAALIKPEVGQKVDAVEFYAALDQAALPHEFHQFEVEQVNLNHFLDKGKPVPFHEFEQAVKGFMEQHKESLIKPRDIDHIVRITGPNGLDFELADNKLYVDSDEGVDRKFLLTGQLYEALMQRYRDNLGYEYHEQFDVDQFYAAVKQAGAVEQK